MAANRCAIGRVPIDMLPEDVLLEIFDWYLIDSEFWLPHSWQTLAHVCQKWRIVVFGSPRRLHLHLLCSTWTPNSESVNLDIWPAIIPIIVHLRYFRARKLDNVIAAIKHNDRVSNIDFRLFYDISQLEEVVSVMQVPFPALTELRFIVTEFFTTVIPDSFLGGSAPRLQLLQLKNIEYPGLPKLLLSATNLVALQVLLPHSHSCYISPDAMATCLSALVHLKLLILEFESPQSRQDQESRHLPPPTRTLLPALTLLRFKGLHEYAEDLMTRVDAPLLHRLYITFFNETVLAIPQISQFVNRIPKFQALALDGARVNFSSDEVTVTLPLPVRTIGDEALVLGISRDESTGQLSSLVRLCRSFLPTLAMVERLYIYGNLFLRSLHRSDTTPIGSNFYICLPVQKIFTYARTLRHLSRPSCDDSSGKERQKFYPPCKTFSYMAISNAVLSAMTLKNLFPHASSPDILLLFVLGTACGGRMS
jgi:hypothetical protein